MNLFADLKPMTVYINILKLKTKYLGKDEIEIILKKFKKLNKNENALIRI